MDLHDFNLSMRRWLCRLSSQIVLCIMATGLFMSHAQTSADTEPRSESITATDSSREIEVLHAELTAKLARLQQEVAKKIEVLATEDPVFAPRDDFESDQEYGQRCLRAAWNAHALRTETEASTLKEINDLREREIDVDVEVTFDDYDANAQIYSITVTEPQSGTSRGVEIHVERDQARALYNHQDELISTAVGRLDAAGKLSLERVSLRLMSPEFRVEEPVHRSGAVIFPGDHMLLDLVLSEDGKLLVLAVAHLVGTRVVVNVIARSLVQNDAIWRWEPPKVMEVLDFMALLSGSDRQYLDMIPDPTDRHLAVRVNGHLYSLDLRSGEILADTRLSGGLLAFDPTGSHLVLVGGGAWESGSPRQPGRLYVLSANDLQPILSYEAPWPDRQSKHDDLGTYQQPNALGFTPAGFLTVATNGGMMFLVDLETGAGLGKVEGPVVMRDPFFLNDSGLSQFVPGSRLFVASEAYPDRGNGFKTQVLDLSTGENRAEIVRSSPASQIAFDPAGRFVAWVGEDSWEIVHADTGDTLFREQDKRVSMLDFGDGGRRLAVGYGRIAVIYRLPDLPPTRQPEKQPGVVADEVRYRAEDVGVSQVDPEKTLLPEGRMSDAEKVAELKQHCRGFVSDIDPACYELVLPSERAPWLLVKNGEIVVRGEEDYDYEAIDLSDEQETAMPQHLRDLDEDGLPEFIIQEVHLGSIGYQTYLYFSIRAQGLYLIGEFGSYRSAQEIDVQRRADGTVVLWNSLVERLEIPWWGQGFQKASVDVPWDLSSGTMIPIDDWRDDCAAHNKLLPVAVPEMYRDPMSHNAYVASSIVASRFCGFDDLANQWAALHTIEEPNSREFKALNDPAKQKTLFLRQVALSIPKAGSKLWDGGGRLEVEF